MNFDEFIDRVQSTAGLESRGEAEAAARVTLATLGERMYRTEEGDVAAQLPSELREWLGLRGEPEVTRRHTDRFRLEEFYNRVSARAEIGFQQAVHRAQAVIVALKASLSPGAWDTLRSAFPDEYRPLFEAREGDLGPPSIHVGRAAADHERESE